MKRIISILCIIFSTLSVLGQEHLTFMGIPMDSNIFAFCKKLTEKGFTKVDSFNGLRIFEGQFTGTKATIAVKSTENESDVHYVTVLLGESDQWNTLALTYNHYKELYSTKYGKASDCVESNPSKTDSNISLMYELHQGRVLYGCVFYTTGGRIELSIEKAGISTGIIKISYVDQQNADAEFQRDLEDI